MKKISLIFLILFGLINYGFCQKENNKLAIIITYIWNRDSYSEASTYLGEKGFKIDKSDSSGSTWENKKGEVVDIRIDEKGKFTSVLASTKNKEEYFSFRFYVKEMSGATTLSTQVNHEGWVEENYVLEDGTNVGIISMESEEVTRYVFNYYSN